MTPTERMALTAAFIAAAAVAGISLSLVPNVELVTLVVFCGGVLLGWRGGFQIGAAGMVVYVLANSAVYGYPPSPVPLLAAQAAGMGVAGSLGAAWGRARDRVGASWALRLLPVFGVVAAVANQVLVNAVSAMLYAADDQSYLAAFIAGMSWGAVQIVWNAVVFAVAGPPALLALRRAARARGWWGAAAVVLVWLLCPPVARAQIPIPAPVDTTAATPGPSPATPDSSAAGRVAAPVDSATTTAPGTMLRRLDRSRDPLWIPVPDRDDARWGGTTTLGSGVLPGQEVGRSILPGLPVSWDRWGLGWGRTRLTYDGFPVNGPVHGWSEPPDMPGAWNAPRYEAFAASGTRVEIGAPRPAEERPLSRFSLTTGGGGRRTTEFALFRNLKKVNVAANLMDAEHSGSLDVSDIDATRFRLRLEAAEGVRPRWSVDAADGFRETQMFDGRSYSQNSRRLQAALGGPTLGGETRIGIQLRREALKLRGFSPARGEVIWDGYTVLGEWAGPAGVNLRAQVDRDRRRGELESARTLDGGLVAASWAGSWGPVDAGWEASVGTQEPWGETWEARVSAAVGPWNRRLRFVVSREAAMPAIQDVLDRPLPEAGLGDYLEAFETAEAPERVIAARVEGNFVRGRLSVLAGGWVAGQEGYRIDANPLWATTVGSDFRPVTFPGTEATVVGAYTRVQVPLPGGFFVAGDARVHSRDLTEVFYLARWFADGDLHWRGLLFKDSLDLDIYGGGLALGPRRNPNLESYPVVVLGRIGLDARVDNGILSLRMDNPLDVFVESDFRGADTVTVLPMSGRLLVIALTIQLRD